MGREDNMPPPLTAGNRCKKQLQKRIDVAELHKSSF